MTPTAAKFTPALGGETNPSSTPEIVVDGERGGCGPEVVLHVQREVPYEDRVERGELLPDLIQETGHVHGVTITAPTDREQTSRRVVNLHIKDVRQSALPREFPPR